MNNKTAPYRSSTLKNCLLHYGTLFYQRISGCRWKQKDLCKILVESSASFGPQDWTRTLDSYFEGWTRCCDVQFAANRFERHALLPEADIYVASWINSLHISQSQKLKWLHLTTTGVDFLEGIDMPVGLRITTSGGIAAVGIAEHVLGLMISLDRRFDIAVRRQSRWIWSQKGILENIRCLRGRTVGIIGLGRSGQAIANVSLSLGMKIIGLCRTARPKTDGIEIVCGMENLPYLLSNSDFVVLCIPLTDATRRLIGGDQLNLMKSTAYLINISRGELLDEKALAQALRKKRIAGAALDVLVNEPPSRCNVLRFCRNLIITPHIAGNIHTFKNEIRERFVTMLRNFIVKETEKRTSDFSQKKGNVSQT